MRKTALIINCALNPGRVRTKRLIAIVQLLVDLTDTLPLSQHRVDRVNEPALEMLESQRGHVIVDAALFKVGSLPTRSHNRKKRSKSHNSLMIETSNNSGGYQLTSSQALRG